MRKRPDLPKVNGKNSVARRQSKKSSGKSEKQRREEEDYNSEAPTEDRKSEGCNLEDGPPVILPEFRDISNVVAQGMFNETEIREATKALFYTRMRLGHFDPPDDNPLALFDPLDCVQSPAHQDLWLSAPLSSFVLPMNRGSFLPLAHDTLLDNLAIVGPMSDYFRGIFGNYSSDPVPNYVVIPPQGLSPLGHAVRYAEECLICNTCYPEYIQSAFISAVTGADLVIRCMGTSSAVEAKAIVRPVNNFPGEQRQPIQGAVVNSGSDPMILPQFNGGPQDVTWAKNNDCVVVIVECFFPGQTSGAAPRRTIYNLDIRSIQERKISIDVNRAASFCKLSSCTCTKNFYLLPVRTTESITMVKSHTSHNNSEFDYAIVDAGSAGCVLANRLSSDGNIRVLLLESGPKDNSLKIQMPAALLYLLKNPKYSWCYETASEEYEWEEAVSSSWYGARRSFFAQH